MTANGIYLLHRAYFLEANANIYKIGRTNQDNLKRFNGYIEGSKLLYYNTCNNCVFLERTLIKIFKIKFTREREYGLEYFRGDYREMIDIIHEEIKKERIICDYKKSIISNDNLDGNKELEDEDEKQTKDFEKYKQLNDFEKYKQLKDSFSKFITYACDIGTEKDKIRKNIFNKEYNAYCDKNKMEAIPIKTLIKKKLLCQKLTDRMVIIGYRFKDGYIDIDTAFLQVDKFIEQFCDVQADIQTKKFDIFSKYCEFMKVSNKSNHILLKFYKALEKKGFKTIGKRQGVLFISGIKLKSC